MENGAERQGFGPRAGNAAGAGLAALLALGACAPEPAPPPGAMAYMDYCAICHGRGAQGDGAIAADLPVPPPDLTRISARNGGVFPLEQVAATVFGYPGKHESDLMPEFAPLLDGPPVTVRSAGGGEARMPQALGDLVLYLETLQRP